jgi:hypothetical protein
MTPLFKRELLRKVLEGQKTQTRRIHKVTLKPGRTYAARCTRFEKAQARILITAARQEKLGDITQEDARKEGFTSPEAFKQAWTEMHGDWNPDQIVTVYDFAKTNISLLGEAGQQPE